MPAENPVHSRPGHQAFALLNVLVTLAIALFSATWLPHYLTWPLWPDSHAYATLAIGWDQGLLPYRDVATFNFPGQIYLFWLLGKVFGWGRTWPFYAADAALLATVAACLIAWSRRMFGERLSGAIGALALAVVLMDLDIAKAAQRDWHSTAFVVISLLLLQGRPSRMRFILSAIAFAAGFVFRPHVVLFGPAIMTAILANSCDEGRFDTRRAVRSGTVWALVFTIAVVAGFLPLITQGLFAPFLEDLKIARHGGSYSGMTLKTAVVLFVTKLVERQNMLLIVSTLTLGLSLGRDRARVVVPWSVAMVFSLAYQSAHPIAHEYLLLPQNVLYAVNLAVLAGLVRKALGTNSIAAAAMTAGVVLLAVNKLPDECNISATMEALKSAVRGTPLADVPHGARKYFHSGEVDPADPASGYSWPDYVATIDYLNAHTGPATYVAGAFKRRPYPAFNGPTGRPSPWPGEAGTPFLLVLGLEWEDAFIEALRKAPEDTVVVWAPDERPEADRVDFRRLDQEIRDHFAPEARFGIFEVRRGIPASKASGP